MVHSAYDTQELLSTATPHQIQALTSHSSATATTLLLGCSDGSLLVYGPPNDPPEPSPSEPSSAYSLRRVVPQFTKRSFLSLQVLHAQELLLSLSESITFHRLPGLETFAVLTKARGANAYCWDDRRGVLCFARQKKVCIFRHDGGRGFVEVKEFGIYDTVKSMAWCGENVCLGIRREYVIMNSSNGALSEVFPCGRLAPPLVVPLPSGELILGKVLIC